MYVATVYVPGHLPESDDPPVFDTAREAWEYLEAEYNREKADPTDRLDRVNRDFATKWNHDVVGVVYSPTPGYDGSHDLGLAYSVEQVECEFSRGWFTGELSCSIHGVYPECLEEKGAGC